MGVDKIQEKAKRIIKEEPGCEPNLPSLQQRRHNAALITMVKIHHQFTAHLQQLRQTLPINKTAERIPTVLDEPIVELGITRVRYPKIYSNVESLFESTYTGTEIYSSEY